MNQVLLTPPGRLQEPHLDQPLPLSSELPSKWVLSEPMHHSFWKLLAGIIGRNQIVEMKKVGIKLEQER